MSIRSTSLTLALALGTALLAGCSERAPVTFTSMTPLVPTASTNLTTSGPQTFTVKTADIPPYYTPDTLTIHVGDTVVWVNTDPETPHTVTADNGSFNSGNLSPQQTWSHTFTAAGTYQYACTLHPWMVGKLVVN